MKKGFAEAKEYFFQENNTKDDHCRKATRMRNISDIFKEIICKGQELPAN